MILTWTIPATQDREMLDALNLASGTVYTRVLVRHWRYYKKHGVWLRQAQAEKLDDALSEGACILHSHSIDAAQQGFYKAIKTARELRKQSDKARFPWRRKRFRTTIFKGSQLKLIDGQQVRLAMANRQYLYIVLPKPLRELEAGLEAINQQHAGDEEYKPQHIQLKEARLVYNRVTCGYQWNLVVEDGREAPVLEANTAMGVDLGEIHPAVCATQEEATIISCRELRSVVQFRNKCLAELSSKMAACTKGSRRWHKLRRAKITRRSQCEAKVRELEHKVSRSVVNEAIRQGVGVIALGDVRNIGVGKRLNAKSQQKISQWSHGRIREYIRYKAAMVGIRVVLESEAYTTQTCPACGHRDKPRGRNYKCKGEECRFVGHRDVVGAANILAMHLYGEPGGIYPQTVRLKHPFDCRKKKKVSGVSASSGPCERVHVAWEQLSLL